MQPLMRFLGTLALLVTLLGLAACGARAADGPPVDVVKNQVRAGILTDADVQIVEIIRGQVFTSAGARDVPPGTAVFPIKAMVTVKRGASVRGPAPFVLFFYKDSFGDWQSYGVSQIPSRGPRP
jgi:hypothetical protein